MTIPSINYHLLIPCNMHCRYCFVTFQDIKKDFLPKGQLSREDSLQIIDCIVKFGFQKITFVGGEPLLCRWLDELICVAKKGGLTTMLVTNGSLIKDSWLDEMKGNLDWITLSIDSLASDVLVSTGRTVANRPLSMERYQKLISDIKERHIRLKINTVVTSLNWQEDLTEFIIRAKPERWKIFQVLPIAGQNTGKVEQLCISNEQFVSYVKRSRLVETAGIEVAPEDNEAMTGSYLMIDPAGRFFDNVDGGYHYSAPILEVGLDNALRQIRVAPERFVGRKGLYNWKANDAKIDTTSLEDDLTDKINHLLTEDITDFDKLQELSILRSLLKQGELTDSEYLDSSRET